MVPRHVISVDQFLDRSFLSSLFGRAALFEAQRKARKIECTLNGRVMVALFYEPSTRTRLSFETAMLLLGGSVVGTESASHFSSAAKGETMEDTIRVVGNFGDVIVIRHPEEGIAVRAASVSEKPIINAGDGIGEHPTQALLDLYTILKELGRIDGIHIALVGDLKHGRTIHSLAKLLSLYNVKLSLVAPNQLKLPEKYKEFLDKAGIIYSEHDSYEPILGSVDVLYVTRVQKERFADAAEYEKLKNAFVVTPAHLAKMKPNSIIMHPLPRVAEISNAVDNDRRAAYFRQTENGLYIRMALLEHVFLDRAGTPLAG